jgi:hypothetical protein
MKIRRLALAVAGLLPLLPLYAPTASAQTCEFDAFEPEAVYHFLMGAMGNYGVTSIPASVPITGVTPGRVSLVAGGAVVGQIQYREDARAETREVTVYDAANKPMFYMQYRSYLCPDRYPAGLCHEITAVTEKEPEVNGVPAYRILKTPTSWYEYSRYERNVGYGFWRLDFNRELYWLANAVANNPSGQLVTPRTLEGRLALVLASDPEIAPYLSQVSITAGRGGRLMLTGVVPSTPVYDLIVLAAIDSGIPFDENLVIYTGAELPQDPFSAMAPCYM